MTHRKFVKEIAQRANVTQDDAQRVWEEGCKVFLEQLCAGERFSMNGIGTFHLAIRSAREGRNPATGERIVIPESKTVKFRASTALKMRIDNRAVKEKC